MLIDLSDPKNRGNVPESVRWLVEVQRVEGQQEPPFFLGPFSGQWSVNPVAKELSDSSDNSIRHARPATAAEIEHEAKCSEVLEQLPEPTVEPAYTGGWSIVVPLTDKEEAVLLDLAKTQELTPWRVMIQALRTYQSVASGHSRLVCNNPMPLMAPLPESQAAEGTPNLDDIRETLDTFGDIPACDTEWMIDTITALRAEVKRLREAAESVRGRLKKDAMRITGGELLELADDLTAALSTSEGGK